MTSHDRELSERKKLMKRGGCLLMLISILVFFSAFLFITLVDCFDVTTAAACRQARQEMNDTTLLLLLALLLFISGVILSWIGSRRAKHPTNTV